jgi:ribosomal-protein-alanine acetyltransferase
MMGLSVNVLLTQKVTAVCTPQPVSHLVQRAACRPHKAKTKVRIRDLSPQDLTAVLAVQHESPGAAQWSESDYRRLAEDPKGMVLVAELSGAVSTAQENGGSWARENGSRTTNEMPLPEVAGFAAFHQVLDEAELRNVAVLSSYRRRGVGRALLDEAHRRLRELGVKQVYLEVRARNVEAIKLYEAAGYRRESIRKDYYQGPDEDAWVMSIALPGPFLALLEGGRPGK